MRYWLHCAHLLVDGQKMAKSLGNFYTVPDVLAKGYTGRELRYALLRVHYRVPLNFTWEGMNEARESLGRIDEWLARLRKCGADARTPAPDLHGFEDALDDDLNISAALGFLFESIRETNRAMDQNEMDAASASAGWTGGNESTPFWILKLKLTSLFRTKWQSSQKSARTHGAKRIGNAATNCASGSLRSAGKCATRKTGQSSPAALDTRSTFCVHCSSNA